MSIELLVRCLSTHIQGETDLITLYLRMQFLKCLEQVQETHCHQLMFLVETLYSSSLSHNNRVHMTFLGIILEIWEQTKSTTTLLVRVKWVSTTTSRVTFSNTCQDWVQETAVSLQIGNKATEANIQVTNMMKNVAWAETTARTVTKESGAQTKSKSVWKKWKSMRTRTRGTWTTATTP